ncbi:MAG: hypothetical protein AAF485_22865, partial [Chloroflexota bacterium]
QLEQADDLHINWLLRRTLFDFNEILISNGTDEDVERLAVQIGNDSDPVRQVQYRQMRCLISTTCSLSENTHRVMQQMVGTVKLEQ